jgi:hypothetical protein
MGGDPSGRHLPGAICPHGDAPDVEGVPDMPESFLRFVSYAALPFPSILVASDDDLYSTIAASRHLAQQWWSRFFNAGAAGHISTESGYGPWLEGEALLQELIR